MLLHCRHPGFVSWIQNLMAFFPLSDAENTNAPDVLISHGAGSALGVQSSGLTRSFDAMHDLKQFIGTFCLCAHIGEGGESF